MAEKPSGESDDRDSEFVQLLTEAQPRLFGYISMLLGGTQESGNVLQETNLVLWKKANEFMPGSNFLAWAREIAYYKSLSYMRDRKRSKLIVDQERIEIAMAKQPTIAEGDDRRVALRHCLTELAEDQLRLLSLRYRAEAPVAEIAREFGKSEAAIKMALRRIRLSLMACIRRKTSMDYA